MGSYKNDRQNKARGGQISQVEGRSSFYQIIGQNHRENV